MYGIEKFFKLFILLCCLLHMSAQVGYLSFGGMSVQAHLLSLRGHLVLKGSLCGALGVWVWVCGCVYTYRRLSLSQYVYGLCTPLPGYLLMPKYT